MNVRSLNFLNLDSSVFDLLVLKNRFITVLAVCVFFFFVFIKLQILFVCVLLQFLTAWFRFAICCQVCFLWGIYLGFLKFKQKTSSTVQFSSFLWIFYVTDSLSCFFHNPSCCSAHMGLFLVCHFPLQFCELYQTKQDNRLVNKLVHKSGKFNLSFSVEN